MDLSIIATIVTALISLLVKVGALNEAQANELLSKFTMPA